VREAAPRSRSAAAFGHRPALDGLRALAALLVVCFHADVPFLDHGYAGVDVFFVLSGFLITSLLVRELAATHRLDVVGFYARRARRLLPASLLVLVVTAALYDLLATPLAVAEVRGGFVAAALYVSNWYFLDQSQDYFAQGEAPSPVLHYWSLSVEEQFYLAWPLLLLGLCLAVRFRPGRLLPVVAGLAAAGAVYSGWLASSEPMESYFGTLARAYQLLVGAAVALVVLRREDRGTAPPGPSRWQGWVAPAGLVLLLVAVSPLQGDATPFTRGLTSCLATAAIVVGLELRPSGALGTALSRPVPRRLGLYSYGIYLWHWPVVVLGDLAGWLPSAWLPRALLVIALSVGLAAASYHLLERRIHSLSLASLRSRRRGALAGPLAALVTVVVVLAVLPVSATTRQLLAEVTSGQDDSGGLQTVEAGPTGPHRREVVMIGDSHADFWGDALGTQATDLGFHLTTLSLHGCPWPVVDSVNSDGSAWHCDEDLREPGLEVLRETRPDVAILVSRSILMRYVDTPDGVVAPGGREWLALTEQGSREYLREVSSLARQVVVLQPIPMVDEPMTECLSTGADPADCDAPAAAMPGTTQLERVWRREAAELPNVTVVDIDDLVCPGGLCPSESRGVPTFVDDNHLTESYAAELAPRVVQRLHRAGVDLVGRPAPRSAAP
jgi:peptidoglycan/LPS O-acetylase OafA/YrhL